MVMGFDGNRGESLIRLIRLCAGPPCMYCTCDTDQREGGRRQLT